MNVKNSFYAVQNLPMLGEPCPNRQYTILDQVQLVIQVSLPYQIVTSHLYSKHDYSPLGHSIKSLNVNQMIRLSLLLQYLYSNPFDEVKCGAFSRAWYLSLPKGSIHSFDQLSNLFVSRFLTNKTLIQSSTHLFSIKQKEGEHLKDFVRRFSSATMKSKGATNDWAIQTFIAMVGHEVHIKDTFHYMTTTEETTMQAFICQGWGGGTFLAPLILHNGGGQ